MSRKALWAVPFLAASTLPALAHPGHLQAHSMAAGLAHPIAGLDHVLAMVAVGLLACQIGGRAVWMLPAAFMSMMVIGGAIGLAGTDLPFVEAAIALSTVAFGMAVALRLEVPVAVATSIVGAFAIFHGHAHGVEMPGEASALGYAAGFVLATGLLHGIGLALGFGLARVSGPKPVQAAGCGTTLAGMVLLAGLA